MYTAVVWIEGPDGLEEAGKSFRWGFQAHWWARTFEPYAIWYLVEKNGKTLSEFSYKYSLFDGFGRWMNVTDRPVWTGSSWYNPTAPYEMKPLKPPHGTSNVMAKKGDIIW